MVLYEVRKEELENGKRAAITKEFDYITFASASGVDAFFEEDSMAALKSLEGLMVVCIGDITAQALEASGRKADLIAKEYSIQGVAKAICQDWSEKTNGRKGV